MADKDVVFWIEASVRELRAELAQAKHMLRRLEEDLIGLQNSPPVVPTYVGQVTEEITALADGVAGRGKVDLYQRRGNDELVPMGTEVQDVYNCVSTAVAENAWVMVQQDATGDWWVTVEDC
jgi:hypothetical protein